MTFYIQTIKIFNFKSFKGEHIISMLDPHFNVIVGSNGSGKSNIIDSILFVLGFKAKKMRHRINSDLIYCGKSRETRSYVELIFNKSGHCFSLKREITPKRNSYFVNLAEVTYQELSEFVTGMGIDIENNRFMILQGEIENISLMKPKNNGMLEYLEDVVGTGVYNEQITLLTDEVSKEFEKSEMASSAFKFAEKEYAYVKERKEKDEKNILMYLKKVKLSIEHNNLVNTKILLEGKILNDEIEASRKEILTLVNKNSESKQKMASLEKELSSIRFKINKGEVDYKKAQRVYNEADTRRLLIEDKRSKINKNIEQVKIDIETRINRNRIMLNEKNEVTAEIKENKKSYEKMNKEIQRLKEVVTKHENTTVKRKITEEIVEAENMLFNLTKERDSLEDEILSCERWEEKITKLKEKKKLKGNNKGEIDEYKKKQFELSSVVTEINTDIKETEAELNKHTSRLDQARGEESENTKDARMSKLFKNMPGYFGRLANLGDVEDRFAIAVSAVAKNALNNIVVSNTKTAEDCIKLLKKNNIERTTFIVLDKMKEVFLKEDFKYLMNCIKCDEKFKKAFFFVFSDTILCENMSEAKRIALGKTARKVVTIDGKLIDKSGLMSGGGTSFKVVKMSNNKIDEITNKVNKLNNALEKMVEEKNKNLELIKSLEANIKELSMDKEVESLEEINSEIHFIENKVKKCNLKALKSKLQEVITKLSNNNLEELNNKLDKMDSIETKKIKGELSILYEKVMLFENRNIELENKLKNYIQLNITDFEKVLLRYEEELNKLNMPEDVADMKIKLESEEQKMRLLITASDETSSQIQSLKTLIGTDFDKEVELKNTIDDNKAKIESNAIKKEKFTTKNNELREQFNKFSGIVTHDFKIDQLEADNNQGQIIAEINDELEVLKKELKKLEFIENESFDVNVINEFNEKSKDYEETKKNFNEFKNRLEANKSQLEALITRKHDEFTSGLNIINTNLKEIYQLLTFGGNAELELVDPLDPFSEGINLSVMPPKKSWKNVAMLSGGEKTISSLALVFALHVFKPSPFYVMDEIDAALDFRNVSIIANYILEKAKNSQFLIISLRDNMFELSNTLLGVYKNDGLSKAMLFDIAKMKGK